MTATLIKQYCYIEYGITRIDAGESVKVPYNGELEAYYAVRNDGSSKATIGIQLWDWKKNRSVLWKQVTLDPGREDYGFLGFFKADGDMDLVFYAYYWDGSSWRQTDSYGTFFVRTEAPVEAPAEATHYLLIKLKPLPGANIDVLRSVINSIVMSAFARVLNIFGSAIGWQLVGNPVIAVEGQETPAGRVPSGDVWLFVFLKKIGSPIGPLASLAIFIVIGLAVYAFNGYAWALYELATARRIEAETQKEMLESMKELNEKGAVSDEEMANYIKTSQQYAKIRGTIFDIVAEWLGITPEQARALVTIVGILFILAFIKSLLR